jgi:hypothetical protein
MLQQFLSHSNHRFIPLCNYDETLIFVFLNDDQIFHMHKNLYNSLILMFTCSLTIHAQSNWKSEMVKLENNKLVYTQDKEFNRIPDFSYAGYKNSNIEIPEVNNIIKTITPLVGDNTKHINDAIQSLKAVSKDSHGIRGVLLLKKGKYEVYGIIKVDVDGLVIKGEGYGNDPDSATVIFCQKPPTAQNYVIGGYALVNRNTPFPQYPAGFVEGVNQTEPLLPKSLFRQQLKDRLKNN